MKHQLPTREVCAYPSDVIQSTHSACSHVGNIGSCFAECPYALACRHASQTVALRIQRAFWTTPITATRTERCSSIFARGECYYTGSIRRRHPIRKHLHQAIAGKLSTGENDSCEISSNKVLGRYVGFADFREGVAPQHPGSISLAVLGAPEHLLKHERAVLSLSSIGGMFGAPFIPASAYCMLDDMVAGTMCGQACVAMAISNLSDRGSKVVAAYDLVGSEKIAQDETRNRHEYCLARSESPDGKFSVSGMMPKDMRSALRAKACSATAFNFRSDNIRFYERVIDSHIRNNLPIIANVTFGKLLDTQPYSQVERDNAMLMDTHSLYIVGVVYSKASDRETTSSLFERIIFHDPASRPYMELTWSEFLQASLVEDVYGDLIRSLVLAGPQRLLNGVVDVGLQFHTPGEMNTLTRLPAGNDWVFNYIDGRRSDLDYRFLLLRSGEMYQRYVIENMPASTSKLVVEELSKSFIRETSGSPSEYWCVELSSESGVDAVYFFDACTREGKCNFSIDYITGELAGYRDKSDGGLQRSDSVDQRKGDQLLDEIPTSAPASEFGKPQP